LECSPFPREAEAAPSAAAFAFAHVGDNSSPSRNLASFHPTVESGDRDGVVVPFA